MSPAKTAAERKADERTRHREAGRKPVQVWVRPEYVPEVRALEAKLQRRESQCKAIAQRLAQGDLLPPNVADKRLP